MWRTDHLMRTSEDSWNGLTDKIYLMDISSDKQCICYVTQNDKNTVDRTSTLIVRKLFPPPNRGSLNPQKTTFHAINVEPSIKRVDINEYFNASNQCCSFLSISPTGHYIALSTYNKEEGDSNVGCVVFRVTEENIEFHCDFKCKGRAIFLDREDELSLAIMSKETLKIYQDIRVYSKDMSYEWYDLTTMKVESLDLFRQYPKHDYVNNYLISQKTDEADELYSSNVVYFIILCEFVKSGILTAPINSTRGEICFWSIWCLKTSGVQIGSFLPTGPTGPGEAVIAVSGDRKYVATTMYLYSGPQRFKVYNLENGCLAYSLECTMHNHQVAHAIFCNNSRYLAVAATKTNFDYTQHGSKSYFEVWDIVNEKSIYKKSKGSKNGLDGLTTRDSRCFKTLKPFLFEEKTESNRFKLKGVYFLTNEEGTDFTTNCFELMIDCQTKNVIEWLAEDKLYKGRTIDKYLADFYCKVHPESIQDTNSKISSNQLLSTYFSCTGEEFLDAAYNERYYSEKSLYDYGGHDKLLARCGSIDSADGKLLLRCGLYTVQLWKYTGDSDSVDDDIQNYQLVYTKPYCNSENKSYYLSPNIWRIESFEDILLSGNSRNLRIVIGILEDDQYLLPHTKISVPYREEFILSFGDVDEFDYRKLEGACQTLYYFNVFSIERRNFKNSAIEKTLQAFIEKTTTLIKGEIEKINGNCSSFKTMEGSKMLTMLASFRKGREILKLLLKNVEVSYNIFSCSVTTAYGYGAINLAEEIRYDIAKYKYNYKEKKYATPAIQPHVRVMSESVLTVLIRERDYHLYHLFYNRILFDSKNAGPGCLSILNDALLLLQELGNIDHYEKSCQKQSYLRAGKGATLPLDLPPTISHKADFQDDLIANIRNIFIFSSVEQIRKVPFYRRTYDNHLLKSMICVLLRTVINVWMMVKLFFWKKISNYNRNTRKKPSNQFITCVIPIPHFNTYLTIDAHYASTNYTDVWNRKKKYAQYWVKRKSLFLQLALDQHSEPNIWKEGDDTMAIILQYKWNAFIRQRFSLVCIIHMVYYLSYCTGVQFAFEMYQYDASKNKSITNVQHIISIILFFCSGAILLILELLQLIDNQKNFNYFRSWYNYVDIAAIVFPFITFLQLILDWNYFYEVSSVCTLVLWLHGIVRLRVFSSFGVTLETILQLFRKVKSVLLILLVVVFGFTHTFIVLLRQQEDQYFQEHYSGETSSSSEPLMIGNVSLYDLSSSNGFNDPFKAFYQVWLFIFGVWDPVTAGDAGDNRMLFVLCIIFAFITVLIFTNMIIALMSSTVDEVKQRGKKVWMTHFAAVIAEIESLTSRSTKLDRANNPAYVFYLGNAEKVKIQEEKLRRETHELRKLLNIDEDEQRSTSEDLKSNTQTSLITLNEFKNQNEKAMEAVQANSATAMNDTKLSLETLKESRLYNELRMQEIQAYFESLEQFKRDNEIATAEIKKDLQKLFRLFSPTPRRRKIKFRKHHHEK